MPSSNTRTRFVIAGPPLGCSSRVVHRGERGLCCLRVGAVRDAAGASRCSLALAAYATNRWCAPSCRPPAQRQQRRRLLTCAQLTAEREPKAEIDWDSLGFGLTCVGSVRGREGSLQHPRAAQGLSQTLMVAASRCQRHGLGWRGGAWLAGVPSVASTPAGHSPPPPADHVDGHVRRRRQAVEQGRAAAVRPVAHVPLSPGAQLRAGHL